MREQLCVLFVVLMASAIFGALLYHPVMKVTRSWRFIDFNLVGMILTFLICTTATGILLAQVGLYWKPLGVWTVLGSGVFGLIGWAFAQTKGFRFNFAKSSEGVLD